MRQHCVRASRAAAAAPMTMRIDSHEDHTRNTVRTLACCHAQPSCRCSRIKLPGTFEERLTEVALVTLRAAAAAVRTRRQRASRGIYML